MFRLEGGGGGGVEVLVRLRERANEKRGGRVQEGGQHTLGKIISEYVDGLVLLEGLFVPLPHDIKKFTHCC